MPTGPRGQKRPADAVALAVMVGRIATGEESDIIEDKKLRGSAGGEARQKSLNGPQRSAIARHAADARWRKQYEYTFGSR